MVEFLIGVNSELKLIGRPEKAITLSLRPVRNFFLTESTPPGETSFSAAKTANLPKIHLGRRTNSMHQVDIDIGGPFATRWTQVAPGGFFRAPTWWSRPGQKK